MLSSLPSSEKAAAMYLIDNLPRISDMQLNMVTGKARLNSSSVIRLCKRMGYKGFLDFREDVRRAEENTQSVQPVAEQPSAQKLMSMVIEKNMETMASTLALVSDEYEKVVRALEQANVVIMFGNGDAIIPCEFIKIKMMKIGKTCVTYSDQDLQVFSASAVQAGDVVLAVSHTGRSKSVVEAMRIASGRGAITIGLTAFPKSPLHKYCKYVLYAGTVDETDAGDIIARRVAEQTILETLYIAMTSYNASDVLSVKRQGMEAIQKMMKIVEEPDDIKN